VAGGAEPQEGSGLARAWTTGGTEGTVATEQSFCFVFAVASYLPFLSDKHNSALSCLANNF